VYKRTSFNLITTQNIVFGHLTIKFSDFDAVVKFPVANHKSAEVKNDFGALQKSLILLVFRYAVLSPGMVALSSQSDILHCEHFQYTPAHQCLISVEGY